MRSARYESRQRARLRLKRRAPGALEAGGDQPLTERAIVDQAPDGGNGGGPVIGVDQQRAVAERAHATDGGRNGGQPGRVGLDQHLGQTLGARDVQEDVAVSIEVEQTLVERDEAAHIATVEQSKLIDPSVQLPLEVSLAAHDQLEAPILLTQAPQHIDEEERVLLGIEPSDAQQREGIGVVGSPGGASASFHIARRDERDGDFQEAPGVTIALGEVRTNDDNGREKCEPAPDGLQKTGDQLQVELVGVPVADVGGEVLPDAKHDPAPTHEPKRSERKRGRMRSEREDDVGVVELPPHAREGSGQGSQDGPDIGEAGVVGQRNELDLLIKRVMSTARGSIESPEQPQPADFPREPAEEAHERALTEDGPANVAVEVIGVGEQSHNHPNEQSIAVSVLIPVRDEGANLDRALPAMLAQQFDGELEFIFAEGGSSDDSRARLEHFATLDRRVRVVENPSGRTPDGLNIALGNARGEFVARMDAHVVYPLTYLADGVARLERGNVAWVTGPKRPRAHGGRSGAVALALASPLGQGPSRHLARRSEDAHDEHELDTGVFTGVWRRSSFERHGGWDPRWLRNQDSELAARFLAAGERIVSLPSMTAEYLPRRTLTSFWRQYYQYGRYRALTLLHHPNARRRSHALPPALVAAVPAAVAPLPVIRVSARAALGAYLAAVAVETARARRVAPLRDVIGLPFAFFAMHFGWGIGMWRGLGAGLRSKNNFHQPKYD